MSLLDRLLNKKDAVKLPPKREPDPEIVSGAMRATRALSKADAALQRRWRLNAEIARAEEAIRTSR